VKEKVSAAEYLTHRFHRFGEGKYGSMRLWVKSRLPPKSLLLSHLRNLCNFTPKDFGAQAYPFSSIFVLISARRGVISNLLISLPIANCCF
jgi:hypothetical protein